MDSLQNIKEDYLNTSLNHARMLVRLEKLYIGESFIEPRLDGTEDEGQNYLSNRHQYMWDEAETRSAFYREHFDIIDYSIEDPKDFDFPYNSHPQLNVHVYLDGKWVRRCRNEDDLVTLDEDIENFTYFQHPTKGIRFKALNVQE